VHELVELRISHIHICCEFRAKRSPPVSPVDLLARRRRGKWRLPSRSLPIYPLPRRRLGEGGLKPVLSVAEWITKSLTR
jgi:hypothetical protein